MRRTIFGFNQQKAIELGLSTTDLLLLNYIHLAQTSPKMIHKEIDGVSYVYLSHKHIKNDLPILGYSEGTLKNKLSDLKSRGVIQSVLDRANNGTMAYYTITKSILEQLFEDYAEEENNEQVINKLPAKSQINDLPSHKNVTSYNNLDNSNLKDNNNTILKNSTAKMRSLNNSGNSLNNIPKRNIPLMDSISDKEYKNEKEEKKEEKKLNLYQKCVLEIDNHTTDERLKQALIDYLGVRLKISGEKRLLGLGQWKGMLNKFDLLKSDKVTVVNEATANGWAGFFEIGHYKNQYQRKPSNEIFGEPANMNILRPHEVEGGEDSGETF